MQKKRFQSYFLLVLMTGLLLLAGCGGGGSGGEELDLDATFDNSNAPTPQRPLLIAQFDSYESNVDTILQVDSLFGLLSNDEYPVFGTTIEFPTQTVQGGDLEVFSGGAFEYEPSAGFVGEDSFTYTIIDNDDGRRSSAQVFITVINTFPRKS